MNTKVFAITAIAAIATAAQADIAYNTQERYIKKTASLFTGSYSQTLTNNTFDDWDAELTGGFSDIEGGVDAYATQTSSFGANSIVASGTAGGSVGPPAGSSAGYGVSHLLVSFSLAQASDYTLDFSMLGEFGYYSLTGGSLNFSGDTWSQIDHNLSGTLAAGEYEFLIDLGTGGSFGNGSFDLNFQIVPTPASVSLLGLGFLTVTRRRRV
ncbi:MAG: PEP-CTERM sorting domain-containing protein [Phycisphaerales bacterium]|nr:PEP-CTERM sorting domain-containing protein [Phycisphaerales bacterium]